MMGLAQREWYEDGFREGLARGEARGQSDLLGRLLRQRFGDLPAELAERMASADLPTLTRWGDRVLDASTVSDVLGDEGR